MRLLGSSLVLFDNSETLRERILQTSARLFAMEGYETVTVRQIAHSSGVSPRQLYKCYEGKRELLRIILQKTSDILTSYYAALEAACGLAATFEQVVDNLFVELRQVTNEFIYFGLCIARQLQFTDQRARRLYCREFLTDNVETVRFVMDRAVERGLCAPFDTLGAASLISSSAIVGNDVRAGLLAGRSAAVDLDSLYAAQKRFILQIARAPGLPAPHAGE